MTKRFTPVSKAALHYEFTVSDSDYHSNPWRGEFTMQRNIDARYGFSCHECNYSMAGMLLGGQRELAEAEAEKESTVQ